QGVPGTRVHDAAVEQHVDVDTALCGRRRREVQHELPVEDGHDIDATGARRGEDQLLLLAQVGDEDAELQRRFGEDGHAAPSFGVESDTSTSRSTRMASRYSARSIRS